MWRVDALNQYRTLWGCCFNVEYVFNVSSTMQLVMNKLNTMTRAWSNRITRNSKLTLTIENLSWKCTTGWNNIFKLHSKALADEKKINGFARLTSTRPTFCVVWLTIHLSFTAKILNSFDSFLKKKKLFNGEQLAWTVSMVNMRWKSLCSTTTVIASPDCIRGQADGKEVSLNVRKLPQKTAKESRAFFDDQFLW